MVKSELARQFLLDKGIRDEDISVAGVGIDIQALETGKDAEPSEAENRMAAQTDGLKLLYIGRIEPRRDRFLCWIYGKREKNGRTGKAVYHWRRRNGVCYAGSAGDKEKGLEDCIFWQRRRANRS